MKETEIVYGITGIGLILIPEKRAKELAGVIEALTTAKTWGEFKSKLPSINYYEKYLKLSQHYQGSSDASGKSLQSHYLPSETPFTPNDVFNQEDDSTHPGIPEIEMSVWVPEDIQSKFGQRTRYYAMDGNTPAGEVLELDRDRVEEIIQAMSEKGYRCRRDDSLIEDVYGSSFDPNDYPEA